MPETQGRHTSCHAGSPLTFRHWLMCRVCWEVKGGLVLLVCSGALIGGRVVVGSWPWHAGIVCFWAGVACLVFGLIRDLWSLCRALLSPSRRAAATARSDAAKLPVQRERRLADRGSVSENIRTLLLSAARYLSRQSKTFIMLTGLLAVAGLGALDFYTGPEISFAVFYLLPVTVSAWFAGASVGALIAEASTLSWLSADVMEAKAAYSHLLIPYWNAAVRLGLFLIVTFSVSALKRALTYARTDYLTGIANGRAFVDLAGHELARARRSARPVTLAYLDVDNFKQVNDRLGHSTGDRLLRLVARMLRANVRATDAVARLGGDEFVILYPETSAEGARTALELLLDTLTRAVRRHRWPVTFSIGAVTFSRMPPNVEAMLNQADEVMYDAKRTGKNRLCQRVA